MFSVSTQDALFLLLLLVNRYAAVTYVCKLGWSTFIVYMCIYIYICIDASLGDLTDDIKGGS